MSTVRCSKCGEVKSLSDFYPGYLSWCKVCRRKQANDYCKNNRDKKNEYEQKNKEHLTDVRKQWALDNPEAYAAIKERAKAKKREENAVKRVEREAAKALETEKQCFKCKERKPFSEFNKNKHKKDGLATYCKICAAEKLRAFFGSDKKRVKSYQRKYRADNMDKVNAYNTIQKIFRRKIAVPPWADLKSIQAFYTEAKRMIKETGTKHQVDHIVPLKHKLVCGLHVPWNLQVLPASENSKKSNRFEV